MAEDREPPPTRDFFRYPGPELHRARRSSRPKRVCVIGGGIAGLVAAYELLDPSFPQHNVVLEEADDRLGGRIRTWRPLADRPELNAEYGPMRIPRNHQGTWH